MVNEREPRDTSPLELDEVTGDELEIILKIEDLLREVQETSEKQLRVKKQRKGRRVRAPKQQKDPFVQAQTRYPRALLLNGGRGTGKTSLLLTLAHHWNSCREVNCDPHDGPLAPWKGSGVCPLGLDTAYRSRVEALMDERELAVRPTSPPDFVRVIGRILDFDSLPSSMPLIAGIVQTCRHLAELYDESGRTAEDCEPRQTLQDRWHELFRVAVAGWGRIEPGRGLMEQVLDREEQIENWHCLDRQWQDFIDEVVDQERCLRQAAPVFVIMIDDVDLQIQRISELLPALRLLYHPNVVFLVAADREHMIDMLKLDFLGQQSRLAAHWPTQGTSLDLADNDRYASRLAISTVDKVFQRRNHWELQWLRVDEFLDFPGFADSNSSSTRGEPSSPSFRVLLDGYPKGEAELEQGQTLAAAIEEFATLTKPLGMPGLMTFRRAHQLYHEVSSRNLADGEEQALRILERVLGSRGDHASLIGRSRPESGGRSKSAVITLFGELAAIFQATVPVVSGTYDVLMGVTPDFVWVNSDEASLRRMSRDKEYAFGFTAALMAKFLEAKGFPVQARGLRWENHLSLAWVEWQLHGRQLSFSWHVLIHPQPHELLKQAQQWEETIGSVQTEEQDHLVDRYAYAWVYRQREWNGYPVKGAPQPKEVLKNGAPPEWKKLLRLGCEEAGNEYLMKESWDRAGNSWDRERWWKSLLRHLARPELGLEPRSVQTLLEGSGELLPEHCAELQRFRRREITDALVAAGFQRGEIISKLPSKDEEDEIARNIDTSYRDQFGSNPWAEKVEEPGESSVNAEEDD